MMIQAAKNADDDANLEEALERVGRAWARQAARGLLSDRIRALRLHAQILRHFRDPRRLPEAIDAARLALSLAGLPAAQSGDDRDRAALELADCQFAAGDASALPTVARLATHETADIAAWACRLLGGHALGRGRVFEAVAHLLDAVAEHRRGDREGEPVTAIALLDAFSRAGHLEDADRIAAQRCWAGVPPRLRLEFLLTRAEHLHRAGRIGDCLKDLDEAGQLIGSRALPAHVHRLTQTRAACLRDWCQGDAQSPAPGPARVPATASGRPVVTWLGSPAAPAALPAPDPRRVAATLDELESVRTIKPSHAALMASEVGALAGVPGHERDEAILLFRAGALLARGQRTTSAAERLLRRALSRLEYLEGAEQWLAQANVELGLLLADSRPGEALDVLVRGLETMDAERFQMLRRSFRTNWLTRRVHPALDRAIELAVADGNRALAADLIIYSRFAGVLARPQGDAELPLDPLPSLTYLDGTQSSLGTNQVCRLL